MTPRKPRILIVGTGGTLSHVAHHPRDFVEYADGGTMLETVDLLTRVSAIASEADVRAVHFSRVRSIDMGPGQWLALNEAIHRHVEDEQAEGVVVVHGTATLEETAYFLNLTLKIEQTTVVVGAQRPLGVLSSDAELNLLNAVRVAAEPAARGLGVLVVLNDEIQAAREVTKGSTHRLETFRSPDVGMLGYADPDGIAIYRVPTRQHAPNTVFDVRGKDALPRVDIVYSYAGADGAAVRAFEQQGARGIVVAALAPAESPSAQEAALKSAAANGVLVVRSSRAGSGRVLRRETFVTQGYVVADNLNPQKARVLAMVALSHTTDRDRIQGYFDAY
jgi:L-asparaginase